MTYTMDDAVYEINKINNPELRNLALPNDHIIKKYEVITGFTFSQDYIIFLKNISNAYVGTISPFYLDENLEENYGELNNGIKAARKIGVPVSWLPICEDNGDYYCIKPNGKVAYWDHNGSTNEEWSDLATWVKEVWISEG